MEKVGDVLQQLADQLGTTVEYLWPILVRQQKIEGIFGLVIFSLLIITALIILKKTWNKKWETEGEPTVTGFAGAISCVVLVVCFLVLAIGGTTIISHIINPEFWALKEITKMIK